MNEIATVIIGMTGVILGSVITVAKDIWVKRKSDKKSKEYLAIRLICNFDNFVENCSNVAQDDGLSDGQYHKNSFLEIQVAAPNFHLSEDDFEWKLLPVQLMYRILAFPNCVNYSMQFLSQSCRYLNELDWFEERQYQYLNLGLMAYNIALELRQEYELPDIEYANEWKPIISLREKKEFIERKRKERSELIEKQFEVV